MSEIDVIGIGAINYDYIFFRKKPEYKKKQFPEIGQEYLDGDREAIYENIDKMRYTNKYTKQVSGSSLFALKTIHAIEPDLKLSYVGVCGKPGEIEKKVGFNPNNIEEFEFLDNKEWLFFDDDAPGISLVNLYKGVRDCIDIEQGVNCKLEYYVKEKEKEKGDFVDFLCKARWIHISSLADFQQFQFLVEKLKQVKRRNSLIKISVDPGYEYTKKHKKELRDIFSIADYVFLNNHEMINLVGDNSLSEKNKYDALSTVFNYYGMSDTQVIIIKNQTSHAIASYEKGNVLVANYWHLKLCRKKIKNDTGAGDAFAGGFISSMLSQRFVVRQPFAISVGALAASARMRCHSEPFAVIANEVNEYIDEKQRIEKCNIRQKISLYFIKIKKQFPAFAGGIVTGVIGSLIVVW